MKKIFFIHGLKGDATAWGPVRAYYDGQKEYAEMPVIDYGVHQNSMSQAASALSEVIHQHTKDDEDDIKAKNFIIAHSLGGIVARFLPQYLEAGNKKPYNGIVTFGSAHKGAKAADNKVLYDYVGRAIDDACYRLFEGPKTEALNTSFILKVASIFINVEDKLDKVCDNLVGFVYDFLETSISGGIESRLTTESYFPPLETEHNIAVYGIEDPGFLVPRIAGTYLNPPATYPVFSADASDNEGQMFFNEQLLFYLNKYNEYSELAEDWPWWCGLSSPTWWICKAQNEKEQEIADAYKLGVDWFNDIEGIYSQYIGAGGYQIDELTYTCQLYNSSEPTYSYIVENPEDCVCCCGIPNCVSKVVTTWVGMTIENKESDGFILKESATEIINPTHDPIVMQGSNHLQMRNDSNTEDVFNKLFRGEWDEFFETL